MDDNQATAIKKAREIVLRAEESLASKTDEMNLLLSNGIPQFRCSDPKFEEIYYFFGQFISCTTSMYKKAGRWKIHPVGS